MAKTIKLKYITKIEGHADLTIRLEKDKVQQVNLKIFEGARFFEGLVTGMHVKRVPVVASRICGVCSQSHLLSGYNAIEKAYGLQVTEQVRALRRLLLNASIIQSHSLHLFLMSLPDYYGYYDAVTLAKEKPEIVNLALKLKMLANKILEAVGGRQIHSVTTRMGGFIRLPEQKEIDDLAGELDKELPDIVSQFEKIFAGLEQPQFESDSDYLALVGDKLRTLSGQEMAIQDYARNLKEYIKDYSSSKFVQLHGKNIMTGPLARININHELLNEKAKQFLKKLNIKIPSKNPFDNNLCQAVEIINHFEECIKIMNALQLKEEPRPQLEIGEPVSGISALEVPRGILLHEYKMDREGVVEQCNIITPTTQNIQSIESDIKNYLPTILRKPEKEIILNIERLIRAYDPCISCSTHFLKVKWC